MISVSTQQDAFGIHRLHLQYRQGQFVFAHCFLCRSYVVYL